MLNLHRLHADEGGRNFDLAGALADAMTWLGRPMATRVNDV